MDEFLHFRLGVAHDAQYANRITSSSMLSEVCDVVGSLHTSAEQTDLYDNMHRFTSGGVFLCLLAQIAWFTLIVGEINSVWVFTHGLHSIPVGGRTMISLVCNGDKASGEKVEVTWRFEALSAVRRLSFCLFVLGPKLFIAIVLGITGSMFLGLSTNQEDLVLNVVALSFVVSIDEELYNCFIPGRVHIALAGLEPLHLKPHRLPHSFPAVIKMVSVTGAVVTVFFAMIGPFFEKLARAQDILCSGNRNFIHATNPASGVVYIAKGLDPGADSWSETEKAIFQVAQLRVSDGGGWELDGELKATLDSDLTFAWCLPERTISFQDTPFDQPSFSRVLSMTAWSVSGGAESLSCVDLDAGASDETSLLELREIVGNKHVTSCTDDYALIAKLCGQANMSRLRTVWPETCGCSDTVRPSRNVGDFTGWPASVFASTAFGCPGSCSAMRGSISSSSLSLSQTSLWPRLQWEPLVMMFLLSI